MTSTAPIADRVRLDRRSSALGGFTITYLRIEILRRTRNRRTLFFTLLFPVLMFFIVGYPRLDDAVTATPVSEGGVSIAAFIMVSMAMYGAMMSATQTGAAVAVERAQGWSRQLRLTPLNPVVNVLIKMIAGMVLGALAVVATYVVGALSGIELSPVQWMATGVTGWLLASATFTTLGLMVGYLVPGENAAQITSLLIVVLAFLGGLFYPVSNMPDVLRTLATFTPVYGIAELARAPLTGEGFDVGALVNVLVWLGVFLTGTVVVFRRDTGRV